MLMRMDLHGGVITGVQLANNARVGQILIHLCFDDLAGSSLTLAVARVGHEVELFVAFCFSFRLS